jgi:hypothetical protein
MSHHASRPNFDFPRGDARLDMTDLYAFPKPGDPAKAILILNVHPSSAVNPPEPTTREPFASGALYELKIDTDSGAIADISYSILFQSDNDGKQTATLWRTQGAATAGPGDQGRNHHQGCTGLSGTGGFRNERRRLPLVPGLAQRSRLLRRARPVQSNAVYGGRLPGRQRRLWPVLELPNSALGATR